MAEPLYVVGDIHGQYEQLVGLLRAAGLLDQAARWAGGAANLWFVGDFFDRGPSGIAVVDLVMRLQQEATAVGGAVQALLGNHEPLILAAARFGNIPRLADTFVATWKRNGGVDADLDALTPSHVEWLSSLPAMAHVAERLLLHADATFYLRYGDSVEAVNQQFSQILHGDDATAWGRLIDDFAQRLQFDDRRPDGPDRARLFLGLFGGRQLIHGHTPIGYSQDIPDAEVREPLVYAGGLCVNVDGGMFRGGPGFVYRLPPLDHA